MPPGSGAGAGCVSILSRSLIKWVFGFTQSRTLWMVSADASEGWSFWCQVGFKSRRAGPIFLLVLTGKMLVGRDGQQSWGGCLLPSPAVSSLPQFPSGRGADPVHHLFQERALLGHSTCEGWGLSALN